MWPFDGSRSTSEKPLLIEQDVSLTCIVCDQVFTWTIGEQRWYGGRGYAKPKRCKICRVKRVESESVIDSDGSDLERE